MENKYLAPADESSGHTDHGGLADDYLLRAVKMGGKQASPAVSALFDRYELQLLRFFRAHGLTIQDAEDLLQITFLKIIEKAQALKEVSNGRAWLWQVARNTLLDTLRKRKFLSRRQELFDEDEIEQISRSQTPQDEFRSRDAEECVTAGLLAFRADYPDRWYVITEQLDGKDTSAISHVIGRSPEAAAVYISQSKKKLVPYIEHCRSLLNQ